MVETLAGLLIWGALSILFAVIVMFIVFVAFLVIGLAMRFIRGNADPMIEFLNSFIDMLSRLIAQTIH